MSDDPTAESRPLLRVVRGDPTPEELAALTTVVLALSSAGGAGPQPPRIGRWADPRHALAQPVAVGPGAWQASGRHPGTRTRAGW